MKNIDELINKSKSTQESKRINYQKISKFLNINFSQEFHKIYNEIGFDYFGGFAWYNSDQTEDYSMIGETLFLRKEFKLPENVIAIADEGESMLFMKCFGDHEEVWWIDKIDIERFCNEEPLEAWNKTFPTFADFFEFLLDEEEKSRKDVE